MQKLSTCPICKKKILTDRGEEKVIVTERPFKAPSTFHRTCLKQREAGKAIEAQEMKNAKDPG